MKNLDTGEKFYINDVDRYCKFEDYDTVTNGGAKFEVKMCGNHAFSGSSTSADKSAGGSFTVYEMEVTERKGDGRRWVFAKRYSDFVLLNDILMEAGYKVGAIQGSLPPKKWFGNLEGDVISFRQRALERYMWLILQTASPDDCTAVRNFLNVSTVPVTARPKPNNSAALPSTPTSINSGSGSFGSENENVGINSDPNSRRGSFQPRSFNDEERALSNMLTLSSMDDGAPTPVKDLGGRGASLSQDVNDEDFVPIRKTNLQDLLSERETLYAEMQRYKDENTVLFRDLGSAEDMVEELQDKMVEMEEELEKMRAERATS